MTPETAALLTELQTLANLAKYLELELRKLTIPDDVYADARLRVAAGKASETAEIALELHSRVSRRSGGTPKS